METIKLKDKKFKLKLPEKKTLLYILIPSIVLIMIVLFKLLFQCGYQYYEIEENQEKISIGFSTNKNLIDEFINNFDPSAFDSLSDEMDAKMVAMLSAPLLPPVIQVQGHGEMPVFIPVFKLLTEELLAEAAARAAKELEQNPDPYYAKTATAMA